MASRKVGVSSTAAWSKPGNNTTRPLLLLALPRTKSLPSLPSTGLMAMRTGVGADGGRGSGGRRRRADLYLQRGWRGAGHGGADRRSLRCRAGWRARLIQRRAGGQRGAHGLRDLAFSAARLGQSRLHGGVYIRCGLAAAADRQHGQTGQEYHEGEVSVRHGHGPSSCLSLSWAARRLGWQASAITRSCSTWSKKTASPRLMHCSKAAIAAVSRPWQRRCRRPQPR